MTNYPWNNTAADPYGTYYPTTLNSTTYTLPDATHLQNMLNTMQREIHELKRALYESGRMHGEMINALKWLSTNRDKTYDDYLKYVAVTDKIQDALSKRNDYAEQSSSPF